MATHDNPCGRRSGGLVLSGGGKRGVFQLAHLDETGKTYTHIHGVSTGILAGAMFAAGKTKQAIQVYTNMANDQIYNHSPLTRKGKFSVPNTVWRLLRGKTSLGELHRLETLIRKNYTEQDHRRVQEQGIDVTAYAHCIQHKKFPQHGFCCLDTPYDTFVKAMVASCCFYPLGHVAKIYFAELDRELEYVDGGHADSITITQMLKKGVRDIDVYILQEERADGLFPPVKNLIDGTGRVARAMRQYSFWSKLEESCYLAAFGADKDAISIRCIYLPEVISKNAMDFRADHAKQYEAMGRDLELVKAYTAVF